MREPEKRSPWLYVFAAPIALFTISSLLTDPFELGERSEAANQPVAALVGLGLFLFGLMGGLWRYSVYSRRNVTALIQVGATLASLICLTTGVVTTIGWWDLTLDGVWLVATALQVFGKPR